MDKKFFGRTPKGGFNPKNSPFAKPLLPCAP